MTLVGVVLTPEKLCEFIGIEFNYNSIKEYCDKHGIGMGNEYKSGGLSQFIYDCVLPVLNEEYTGEFQFYNLSIDEWEMFFGFEIEHKSTPEEVISKIARFKKETGMDCIFYNN
jgi:hypothetical protein